MKPAEHIPLSQETALVTTLAGTAMAFSHSGEDEAERWLRALRLHGQVGDALQALGVGEAPLTTASTPPGGPLAGTPPLGEEAVARVVRRAELFAIERKAETVSTPDLLFALFEVYGKLMDRALYLRGASREELIERLAEMGQPVQPYR